MHILIIFKNSKRKIERRKLKREELKKKEFFREKEKESEKNEVERKEENAGENHSDDKFLSCKEVDLNSNDLSLSRDVEIILQAQEPCDFTSTLRINN
jgi:hypothetical protein